MLDVLNTINFLPLAELEVGQHFYWELGNFKIHGQILLTSWFVIALLLLAALVASINVQRIPSGMQNFMEYVLEFIRSLAKDQIGEKDYRPWVPFVGTLFL
ncbi:MAG: F0F1 ATP synthase subunit A, partial [Cyanobacteria bacterium P01_H01_bin.35]